MATHSSIIAWRIPWTEEPGGLQSLRLQRTAVGVGLNVVTKTTTNNTVSQIIQETGNNPLTLVLHAFICVCVHMYLVLCNLIKCHLFKATLKWASLMAQTIKNLSAMPETRI